MQVTAHQRQQALQQAQPAVPLWLRIGQPRRRLQSVAANTRRNTTRSRFLLRQLRPLRRRRTLQRVQRRQGLRPLRLRASRQMQLRQLPMQHRPQALQPLKQQERQALLQAPHRLPRQRRVLQQLPVPRHQMLATVPALQPARPATPAPVLPAHRAQPVLHLHRQRPPVPKPQPAATRLALHLWPKHNATLLPALQTQVLQSMVVLPLVFP